MKKLRLNKDALIIAILTLITALAWVGFDVYRSLTKTKTPKVLKEQTAPLNPKLSLATLEKLGGRVSFSKEEVSEVAIEFPKEKTEEEIKAEPSPEATESSDFGD